MHTPHVLCMLCKTRSRVTPRPHVAAFYFLPRKNLVRVTPSCIRKTGNLLTLGFKNCWIIRKYIKKQQKLYSQPKRYNKIRQEKALRRDLVHSNFRRRFFAWNVESHHTYGYGKWVELLLLVDIVCYPLPICLTTRWSVNIRNSESVTKIDFSNFLMIYKRIYHAKHYMHIFTSGQVCMTRITIALYVLYKNYK